MRGVDETTPVQSFGVFVTSSSFAQDGRLAAVVYRSGPGWGDPPDIALVSIENWRAREEPLIHTPYADRWPEFSPDGHWLAYGSNMSGQDELYVQPYPGPGGAVPVTVGGGGSPAWHPNGRQIFFLSAPDRAGARRTMTVSFEPASPPRVGPPRALFEFNPNELAMACDFTVRCYDLSPDGRRFYTVHRPLPPHPHAVTHVNVVQNWFEELKAQGSASGGR